MAIAFPEEHTWPESMLHGKYSLEICEMIWESDQQPLGRLVKGSVGCKPEKALPEGLSDAFWTDDWLPNGTSGKWKAWMWNAKAGDVSSEKVIRGCASESESDVTSSLVIKVRPLVEYPMDCQVTSVQQHQNTLFSPPVTSPSPASSLVYLNLGFLDTPLFLYRLHKKCYQKDDYRNQISDSL